MIRLLLVFVVIAGVLGGSFSPLLGDQPACTSQIPPALTALGVEPTRVLTTAEAGRIRGQAIGEADILSRMAAIEQQALDLEGAASAFVSNTGVVELPDQIFSFNGVLFGDGVLVNQNTGSGALFDFDNSWLLLLSDLKGDFTVTRTAEGLFLNATSTP